MFSCNSAVMFLTPEGHFQVFKLGECMTQNESFIMCDNFCICCF